MIVKYICMIVILYYIQNGNAEILDYFKNIGAYFGYERKEPLNLIGEVLEPSVLYEVTVPDQKFISEASKLTGVALSELDSCQHRVVLKLQTSCDRMNDEQLAKMAVMLLNCQSAVEGRTIYPCTDTMSIKDCTSSMDPDTWNSYHLMSNRARAVCYSIRQIQFRGLTEVTVNKLMDAARNQLSSLKKLAEDQENLHDVAQQSLDAVREGQEKLISQQKDLQRAQLFGHLAIENNIKRLSDEKQLILETRQQLIDMTESMQVKLEQASLQLKKHTEENNINHQELLDDLIAIQDKTQLIFEKLEASSELLLKQSEAALHQYQATFNKLSEVNATVYSLVELVDVTRKALEEKLTWISDALGGTDLAVDRLYIILWHVTFLVLAMIVCAFLGTSPVTRFIVATLPPINLVLTLHDCTYIVDLLGLSLFIGSFILIETTISTIMECRKNKILQQALPWVKQKLMPKKNNETIEKSNHSLNCDSRNSLNNNHNDKYNADVYQSSGMKHFEEQESEDEYNLSTSMSTVVRSRMSRSRSNSQTPLIINGITKTACKAATRLGTPCKLSSLPGRLYCYRHQSGSSVLSP